MRGMPWGFTNQDEGISVLATRTDKMEDKVRIRRIKAAEATPGSSEVGEALRSIYQCTVDEEIPEDLLDLLGKLS